MVGIPADVEAGKKRSCVPPRGGRLGPITALLLDGLVVVPQSPSVM
jgi:hypothetical protein